MATKKRRRRKRTPSVLFHGTKGLPPFRVQIPWLEYYGIIGEEVGSRGEVVFTPSTAAVSSGGVTAAQLRKIVDKMDRLNGIKTGRQRGTPGRCFIEVVPDSKTRRSARFGYFKSVVEAENGLQRRGWEQVPGNAIYWRVTNTGSPAYQFGDCHAVIRLETPPSKDRIKNPRHLPRGD